MSKVPPPPEVPRLKVTATPETEKDGTLILSDMIDLQKRVQQVDILGKVKEDQVQRKEDFIQYREDLFGFIEDEVRMQHQLDQVFKNHATGRPNEITDAQKQEIGGLDPNAPNFTTEVDRILADPAHPAGLQIKTILPQIAVLNQDIDDRFNEIVRIVELEEILVRHAQNKYFRTRQVSKITGIDLQVGKQLQFTPADDLTAVRNAEIVNIEYQRDLVNYKEDVTEGTSLEDMLVAPYNLFITINEEDATGAVTQRILSEKRFGDWVREHNVVEQILSKADLEEALDLADYGQTLEEGATFEYLVTPPAETPPQGGAPKEPVLESIKILKIDETTGEIILDKSIQTNPNSPMAKRHSFGEFARWVRLNRANPTMSLSEAQELLKKFPTVYKDRYRAELARADIEFEESPIEIKEGEVLIYGDARHELTIEEVSGSEIRLSNDKTYTPGQFIQFIKDHEVEKKVMPEPEKGENEDTSENKDKKSKKKADQVMPDSPEDRKGILTRIRKSYTWLSIADLIKIFDVIEEHYKRRQDTQSKLNAAGVLQKLGGQIGAIGENMATSANSEELKRLKDEMENNKLVPQLIQILKESAPDPKKKLEFRAAIELLCSNGALDTDDKGIWEAMNAWFKWNADPETYALYSINTTGGVNASNEMPATAIRIMMNKGFWAGRGDQLLQENRSKYRSEVDKFKEEALTEGAHKDYDKELLGMLYHHQENDGNSKDLDVPVGKFEGYLRFIIENGKVTPEDKIFFLIAGFVVPNKVNNTCLLSKSKFVEMAAALAGKFPHLEFFQKYQAIKGSTEEAREFFTKIYQGFKPNLEKAEYDRDAVKKYFTEEIMTQKDVLLKISKGAESLGNNLDHNDIHHVIPLLNSSDLLRLVERGRMSSAGLSGPGIGDGLKGFNIYLQALGRIEDLPAKEKEARKDKGLEDHTKLAQQVIKSFLYFESSATGRVSYGSDIELSSEQLAEVGGGNQTIQTDIDQVKSVLESVFKQYNISDEKIKKALYDSSGKTNQAANTEHKEFMGQFVKDFDNAIQRDGAGKMMAILSSAVRSNQLKASKGKVIQKEE